MRYLACFMYIFIKSEIIHLMLSGVPHGVNVMAETCNYT